MFDLIHHHFVWAPPGVVIQRVQEFLPSPGFGDPYLPPQGVTRVYISAGRCILLRPENRSTTDFAPEMLEPPPQSVGGKSEPGDNFAPSICIPAWGTTRGIAKSQVWTSSARSLLAPVSGSPASSSEGQIPIRRRPSNLSSSRARSDQHGGRG